MAGLRVELAVDSPSGCPVAGATDRTLASAGNVSWSDAGGTTVEQFELDDPSVEPTEPAEPVFEHERGTVYEFERDGEPCACERLEAAGHPVADVRAEEGSLRVTVHLDDGTELGDLLNDVRETAESVSVRSISRSAPDDAGGGELVPVDRSKLTDRQTEVLRTAHAMGYYDYPRGANASEVAEALEICPSTLIEHLAAAQSKILGDVLGEDEQQAV